MTADTSPMASETEFEEPYVAAVRLSLGLRPTSFAFGDPAIDSGACPAWCHMGLDNEGVHEVDPETPFDAHHVLGVEPEVALSSYAAQWHREPDLNWFSTSSLRVHLRQVGRRPPTIELSPHIRSEGEARPSVHLTVLDARDLIAALDYIVALADGERSVVEGAE